jgi:hypothetical protein
MASGFHTLGFSDSDFFTQQGCQSCAQSSPPPPNIDDQVSEFMSSDRVTQLYTEAPSFILIASCYSQDYGCGSLPWKPPTC